LTPSTLDEDKLPAAIQFGRNYENKARLMFIKSHRYHHRKCSYFVPGLMVSKSNVFLGASPDGVVKCSICGEFLVEIKCFWYMQLECISLNQKQPVDHVSGKNIYALESYEGYCHLLSRILLTQLKHFSDGNFFVKRNI
jgi:hypothetical protein